MKHILQPIRNQKGILTLDAIFGISLAFGGMLVVFAITITFSAIEVAQYIAFSTSRAYYAANVDEDAQSKAAEDKFNQFKENRAFNIFLKKTNWFEIRFLGAQDYKSEYSDVISGPHSPMQGTKLSIKAKILAMKIPFFGPTSASETGLSTSVDSLIGREPTREECLKFYDQKLKKTMNIMGSIAPANIQESKYVPMVDDGW